MRTRLLPLLFAVLAMPLARPEAAQAMDATFTQGSDRPVVVELYTSQGCSSCPPADEFLTELAPRDDVIALALHVDYWDYIGWKDDFAAPQYSKRQKAYAVAASRRSIYTPQMIVQGQEHVVGNHPKDVGALIAQHAKQPHQFDLTLRRSGNTLEINAKRLRNAGPVWVQLVRYHPEEAVNIRSGENAGRRITYSNIVTAWLRLEDWNGKAPLDLTLTVDGNDPLVVILQEPGPGRILAAARLR